MNDKRFGSFWSQYWLSLAIVTVVLAGTVTGVLASADTQNPIGNFHEVAPKNLCGPGEGAGERAAGTVFRGARPGEAGLEYLAAHGVKSILNLETGAAQDELDLVKRLGLPLDDHWHRMVGLSVNKLPNGDYDHESIIEALAELRRPENLPIYVHCKAGRDRTGMVIALHRVFDECWSPEDAENEWNRIEGWWNHAWNEAKHVYFHSVMNNPELRKMYEKRLAELAPSGQ